MNSKIAYPKNRLERKRREVQQKIINSALTLFQQQGIDATSMEQIATAADIARGTLYNYFPVKEAIISLYIEQVSEEKNVERIAALEKLPNTRTRMTVSLEEMMAWVNRQRDLFEKYFTYRVQHMVSLRRNEENQKGLLSLEAAIINLGQQSGEIRTDIPFEILQALFEFAFIEVAQHFYKDPDHFDGKKTIADCVELFINGTRRL